MKAIIYIVLAVICLPFVAVGLYEANLSRVELREFSHAAGIVTGNSYQTTDIDGNISGAYHPRVEFTGADGARHIFTDPIGSLPPDYEEGSRVEVVFDQQSPQTARIYSWKRFWLAPVIFIAAGLLPLVVAFAVMRRINF